MRSAHEPRFRLFLLFALLTLAITAAAARRTTSAGDFYTAGGRIRGWQNGLALAGDYLSAAAFLGAAGMYLSQGYDSLAYAVGTLAGWPLLLLLLAEKLRGSGCYTAAAVLSRRFNHDGVRLAASVNSLTVTLFYLIVQMVGAGKLIELLFGLPYLAAVSLVGALMVLYVALGGMLATTCADGQGGADVRLRAVAGRRGAGALRWRSGAAVRRRRGAARTASLPAQPGAERSAGSAVAGPGPLPGPAGPAPCADALLHRAGPAPRASPPASPPA